MTEREPIGTGMVTDLGKTQRHRIEDQLAEHAATARGATR